MQICSILLAIHRQYNDRAFAVQEKLTTLYNFRDSAGGFRQSMRWGFILIMCIYCYSHVKIKLSDSNVRLKGAWYVYVALPRYSDAKILPKPYTMTVYILIFAFAETPLSLYRTWNTVSQSFKCRACHKHVGRIIDGRAILAGPRAHARVRSSKSLYSFVCRRIVKILFSHEKC